MIEIQKYNNNKKFNEMLKKVSFRFPVAEISKKVGYNKGDVSSFLNDKKPVSDEFLNKFAKAYDLNLDDFNEVKIEKMESEAKVTGYYLPDISDFVDLDDELNNEEVKRLAVTIPGWENDIIFINVFGDSMSPKYNAGEIIGVKYIHFEYLNYGFPYVVVFKNGEVHIKRVQQGADKEHLLLQSINDFYKPKEFHLDQIKSFYSIKGVIKKEMM